MCPTFVNQSCLLNCFPSSGKEWLLFIFVWQTLEPFDLLIERGTRSPRSQQGYRWRIQTLDVVLEGAKEGTHDWFWSSSNGVDQQLGGWRVGGFSSCIRASPRISKTHSQSRFFAILKKNCSPTTPYPNFQSFRKEKLTYSHENIRTPIDQPF